MACSKSRNNAVLMYFALLFFSSPSLCTNFEKQNLQQFSVSPNRNLQWHHGKLLIGLRTEQAGKSKEATNNDMDYQSDMVWEIPEQKMVDYAFPGYDNTAVERLLKMNPTVDCSGGHMRLQIKNADSRPGALLFVDRGDLSPLSLSKLPKSCGYKISSTRRDFVMMAPYDGCFVLVKESCYVLPLRWFGLPVQISCPLALPSMTSANTPMVTCHPGGMVITTDWTSALSEIKINLRDTWVPLTQVSAECNVAAVEHSEGITLSFSYKPACVEKKDGMYIIQLSGDVDVRLSCPPLSSTGPPQLLMDVERVSTPAPTAPAPPRNVKNTPHAPQFDLPQTPGFNWEQFYSWYGQQPAKPNEDKVVEQPFFQDPESIPPGLEGNWHYSFSNFQPNMPSRTAYEQGQLPKPGTPSVDMPPLYDPLWYWPEPQPIPPFYLPTEPVQPEVPPPPTVTLKPVGSPAYPCPFYHTTASPPATVPQHFPLFDPYYHPHPYPHLPHSTTIPTPSIQKPQYPPNSHPGTVVVLPKHPQPEVKHPMECLQYCQVGLVDCCPQIAFHQHNYHFVSQQPNGNLQPPLFPLPELPIDLRPDSFQAQSQDPQEAPAPPSHVTFTNALVPPQLYPLEGHMYHQPQEGRPASLGANKPIEQTDSPPAYFNSNFYFPSAFDMNLWNPQAQPEGTATRAHSYYSEFFNPPQGANPYVPYNVQSSHQSDGPLSNTQSPNLLSRIQQYASQSANKANIDVKEPALVFRNQQNPQMVPYGTLHERHISNIQTSHASKRTPRDYVLLKQGPPGRESLPPIQFSPVMASDSKGPKAASDRSNKPVNLKGESKDSKKQNGEDAGISPGEPPGRLPHSAPAGPNSPPLSQSPVNGQFFRNPLTFLPF